jgi:hypothetical protein
LFASGGIEEWSIVPVASISRSASTISASALATARAKDKEKDKDKDAAVKPAPIPAAPDLKSVSLTESVLPKTGIIHINFMRKAPDEEDSHAHLEAELENATAPSLNACSPVPDFRRSLTVLTLIQETALHFEDKSLMETLLTDYKKDMKTSQKSKFTGSLDSNYVDTEDASSFQSSSDFYDNSLKRAAFTKSLKMALLSARKKISGSRADSIFQNLDQDLDDDEKEDAETTEFSYLDQYKERGGGAHGRSDRRRTVVQVNDRMLAGDADRQKPERSQLWEQFLTREAYQLPGAASGNPPPTAGGSDTASSSPKKGKAPDKKK